MTELAAVPSGVLFVREKYRMNPRHTSFDGKVLPSLDGCPLDGYTFQRINQFDFPFALRSHPINAIDTLREFGGERIVSVFPDASLAQGMTTVALRFLGVIGAGSKERPPLE